MLVVKDGMLQAGSMREHWLDRLATDVAHGGDSLYRIGIPDHY